MFCTSGPNLFILAWTGDELSCEQACDWYRHTLTHRHSRWQGQNWPQVKTWDQQSHFFTRAMLQLRCLPKSSKPGHRLTMNVKMHWNSTCLMVERFLEQRPATIAALMDAKLHSHSDAHKLPADLCTIQRQHTASAPHHVHQNNDLAYCNINCNNEGYEQNARNKYLGLLFCVKLANYWSHKHSS